MAPSRIYLGFVAAMLIAWTGQIYVSVFRSSVVRSLSDSSSPCAIPVRDASPKKEETTAAPTTTNHTRVAIGILSAFDWQNQAPFVSFRSRRQMHRDTWMQHPAILGGKVKVYFVIGNQQHPKQGTQATHKITELESEMKHYGDIVLLNSSDLHNHGKNNAWYEWAAESLPEVDFHAKLDDESYVVVDNLLHELEYAPTTQWVGGTGKHDDAKYEGTVKRFVPWLRGWGYILSGDLMKGLGQCSAASKELKANRGQHEDIYHAIALQVCGLTRGLKYRNELHVHSLRHLLALGCPKGDTDRAIFIHGGMRVGKKGNSNAFTKVSAQTFHTLHSIYHPLPGDSTPSWAKWEGLRQHFLNDLKACEGEAGRGWTCNRGIWKDRTCVPRQYAAKMSK